MSNDEVHAENWPYTMDNGHVHTIVREPSVESLDKVYNPQPQEVCARALPQSEVIRAI